MKYTDKLGLPIWNKPETDVFDIEQFNEGMQAIDDIIIKMVNQINDLAIGDTKVDLNEYVKEEVLKKYDKRIETINSQLDNKVSYPILNGEIGAVNVLYPYGDIRRYGAIGDGKTDCSNALKNAISFSIDKGYPVVIKDGKYVINSTIIMQENKTYRFEGNDNGVLLPKSDLFEGELYSSSKPTTVYIYMTGINVAYGLDINDFTIFKGIKFKPAIVKNCNFSYMGTFLEGCCTEVTTLENNTFFGISKYFIINPYKDNTLNDSFIRKNRISGRVSQNPIMFCVSSFDVGFYINDNWIELFKYCIDSNNDTSALSGAIFVNNAFNNCYRLFNEEKTYKNFQFINNTFEKFKKNGNLFKNASEEMTNSKWGVVIFDDTDQGYIYDSSFNNNNISDVDYYIFNSLSSSNSMNSFRIIEKGTIGNANIQKVKFTTRNASDKSGFKDTFIELLDNQDFESVPNIVDGNIVSFFNNQKIFVNGEMYIAKIVNSNFKWVKISSSID